MRVDPFPTCSSSDDCGPGYRCEGGICVPDTVIGGGDPVNPLPGLGNFLTKRYTSNLPIVEQMTCLDVLYDVLLPANRGFLRQSQFGRLGLQIKKPAPYAFSTAAITAGDTLIDFDNVASWIGTVDTLLLIAPHTNKSQVVRVAAAQYSTAQNAVGLSSTGGLFSITGFAGCDGANTPATASITVTSASSTACTITLNGKSFEWTPTSADTTVSIAAYIAGVIRAHPAVNRSFEVSYVTGDSAVHLTARFGKLTLSTAISNTFPAPLADVVTALTLTASGSGSLLPAGQYAVAYSAVNDEGETLLSKYKVVTITAGQNIVVPTISLPTGTTAIKWYVTPEASSTKLRYLKTTDGTGFTIDGTTIKLPLLSDPLPADLNRTGVEVMRIAAVFTDRGEERTSLGASNVFKASYSWTGNQKDNVNVVQLKYRRASEDYRLVTKKYKDPVNIKKIAKQVPVEINGQAINSDDQADRIGLGMLAERQDANFFYKWKSVRDPDGGQVALLLQEGDVVACTDDGSGVYNIPVFIEEIDLTIDHASFPIPEFTARKYSSRLYDDSIVEAVIPVVSEAPVNN